MRSDLWLPLSAQRAAGAGGADMFGDRRIVWLAMGGRLKDGVTRQQADAELRSIGDALAREYPQANANRSLRVAASAMVPGRIMRNAFVVGQVTLSLLLVIAAGLFLRALGHAAAIRPGFDQANVDVVALDFSLAGYNEAGGQRSRAISSSAPRRCPARDPPSSREIFRSTETA